MARSLGTLTLDLALRLAGFEGGLDRAARISEQRMRQIRRTIENAGKAIAAGLAVGAAGAAAFGVALAKTLDSVANYQDIADKIGDSAEAVASLQRAADVGGASIDTVAAATVKLTASLSKLDDEGKGAGLAIRALGLDFDTFKNLSPVDQFEAVAVALDGFADGAGKTAIAVQLFGKSGAELLTVLDSLANESQRQVLLTNEQIAAADDLADTYAGLQSDVATLGKQFAVQFLPALKGVLDVLVQVKDEQKGLVANDAIGEWAEGAAVGIVQLGEVLGTIPKFIRAMTAAIDEFASYADVAFTFVKNFGVVGLMQEKGSKEFKAALQASSDAIAKTTALDKALWDDSNSVYSEALKKRFENTEELKRINQDMIDAATGISTFRVVPDQAIGFLPGFDQNSPDPAKPELSFRGIADKSTQKQTISEAQKLIDTMQQQVALSGELSKLDEIRISLANGYYGIVSAGQAAELERLAVLLDAKTAETEVAERMAAVQDDLDKAIADATASINDDFKELSEKANETFEEISEFALQASRNMQDALAQFLFDPFAGGLKGMLSSFADTLRQMAAQAAAAQIFKSIGSALGGTDWGGAIAGIFGGAKALGGPVSAGSTYLVGEAGPELFSPGTGGTITPNSRMGGGVTQVFNITTPNADSFRASERQLLKRARMGLGG